MVPNPEVMAKALAEYRGDPSASMAAIARNFGLNQETFRRRVHGYRDMQQAHERFQKLSKAEEDEIVRLVASQCVDGFPMSKSDILEFASYLLFLRRRDQHLGKNWFHYFVRRNNDLQLIQTQRVEIARLLMCTKARISAWFDVYKKICDEHDLSPAAIWNMDETGCAMNDLKSREGVYTTTDTGLMYLARPPNRKNVTAIVCVSAAGRSLMPHVIFDSKRKNTEPALQHHYDENYTVHASETSFTTMEIHHRWFEGTFIPSTGGIGPTRLLILDGASAHKRSDTLALAKIAGVILLFLPSHTSHLLQPLDVGVFSPLKTRYRKELARATRITGGASVTRDTFFQCFSAAFQAAVTPTNARAGFSHTGLYPRNRRKALESKYIRDLEERGGSNDEDASQAHPPSTPRNTRTRSVLREVFNVSPSACRSTRHLKAKIQRICNDDESVTWLTQSLVDADRHAAAQAATIARLTHEKNLMSELLVLARQKGKRINYFDPNHLIHGIPDANYGELDLTRDEVDEEG